MQHRSLRRTAAACLIVLAACGGERDRPAGLLDPEGEKDTGIALTVQADTTGVERSRLETSGVIARVTGEDLPETSTLNLFARTDNGRIVYAAQLPVRTRTLRAEFTVKVAVGSLAGATSLQLVAHLLVGQGATLGDTVRLRLR